MTHYLFTVFQPDGPPPAEVDLAAIGAELGALEAEMKAAGVWVFTAALTPPASATVAQRKGDEVLLTDGPYTEGKEHVGGFTIIQAEDLDDALGWANRMARIIGLPVEV